MKKTAIILLGVSFCFHPGFCFLFAVTLPTEEIKRDRIHTYSNMVIRVLLERESSKAKFISSLNGTFIKIDEGRSWEKFPKEINISLQNIKKKPTVSLNGSVVSAKHLLLRAGSHYSDRLKFGERYYRGALKITTGTHQLSITNVLPINEYLSGTLAAEMHGSWELEALKAQAVASRTYALYMIRHPKNTLFDLDGSTQDQVYGGSDRESKRIARVLSETEGLYLSLDGEPIKSYFHSRCGGTTETASNVWNFKNHPFKSQVPCPYCRKDPYRWVASISMKELLSTLKIPLIHAGDISNLAAEKTASGRVSALKLKVGSIEKRLSSDELRGLFGYSRIKSANFDWKVSRDRVLFEGRGNGHGVGMCQWGARYLAKQGKNYKEILAHYYPGIAIEKLD